MRAYAIPSWLVLEDLLVGHLARRIELGDPPAELGVLRAQRREGSSSLSSIAGQGLGIEEPLSSAMAPRYDGIVRGAGDPPRGEAEAMTNLLVPEDAPASARRVFGDDDEVTNPAARPWIDPALALPGVQIAAGEPTSSGATPPPLPGMEVTPDRPSPGGSLPPAPPTAAQKATPSIAPRGDGVSNPPSPHSRRS